MSTARFLRSKLVPACILVLGAAAWSWLAALFAVPPAFIALSDGILALGAAVLWLWQYLRARRPVRRLPRAAEEGGADA